MGGVKKGTQQLKKERRRGEAEERFEKWTGPQRGASGPLSISLRLLRRALTVGQTATGIARTDRGHSIGTGFDE